MRSWKTLFVAMLSMLLFAGIQASAQAAIPGDNSLITFDAVDPDTGSRDIYVTEPDGTNVLRLTDPADGRYNLEPAIGPNSDEVVYSSNDQNVIGDQNTMQLRSVNTDGSGDDHALTSEPAGSYMPSFFPQGNGLLFIRDYGSRQSIMRLMPDGSEFETAVTSTAGNGIYGPSASPQMTAVAWIGPDGLMIQMIASPGGPQLIAPEVVPYENRPTWSPDGTRIAFVSRAVMDGDELAVPAGIQSVDQTGDRRLEVPDPGDGDLSSPAYSPDGKSLAYVVLRNGRSTGEIQIRDLATGDTTALDLEQGGVKGLDWGERPAAVPPPDECVSIASGSGTDSPGARAKLVVLKKKPAYRMTVKRLSPEPGRVDVTFFVKKKDGRRGTTVGKVSKYLAGNKSVSVRKSVTPKKAKKLRKAKFGYRIKTPASDEVEPCPTDPEPQPE